MRSIAVILGVVLFTRATLVHSLPDDDIPFQPSPIPDGKAMIYLYSSGEQSKDLVRPTVLFDGNEIGTLQRSIYITVTADPGRHKLLLRDRSLLLEKDTYSMELDMEAGKYYYVAFHGEKGKVVRTRNSRVQFVEMKLMRADAKKAHKRLDDLYSEKQLQEIMQE